MFTDMKVTKKSYDEVLKLQRSPHEKPVRGTKYLRKILMSLLLNELNNKNFSYKKIGMNKLEKNEPAIFMMNHSSSADLEILKKLVGNRSFYIVGTHDSFIGKKFLMKNVAGIIPAKKLITDINLINDIKHVLYELKASVFLLPEASWCLGGKETILPESLGKMLKYFKVPVINIKTYGAYQRRPQYNNAHNTKETRNVNIYAEMTYLYSKKDLEKLSGEEINDQLKEIYTYDHFRWQSKNKIKVNEPYIAKGLHHVLYKCPKCNSEGTTNSFDNKIICENCGEEHILNEFGELKCLNGKTKFKYVTDWYDWEDECVKKALRDNKYNINTEVEIYVVVNNKSYYDIGYGKIHQDKEKIELFLKDRTKIFEHKHSECYSLYADFHFYGYKDVISFGNTNIQYYCFPKFKEFPILKSRFAAEEAYKMLKSKESKNVRKD